MMSVLRILKKFKIILSKHQQLRIIELLILMFIGGILESCSVSLILPFMNGIMDLTSLMENKAMVFLCNIFYIQSSRSLLVILAISLAILYIVKNIYLLIEYNIQYRFVYGNMFEMQRRLLGNFINRPYEFFLSINSGEIIRIINADTANAFNLLVTIINLFTEFIVAMMLIATIFVIVPSVTVVIGSILLLLVFVIDKAVKPILHQSGVTYQSAATGMNKWLLQSIQGIKEIKVMEKEGYFRRNFDRYGYTYVDAMRKGQVYNLIPKFVIEAVSMGTIFLVIAGLIINGFKLKDIIPIFSAIAMAALRLLPSVNRISIAMASISYNEPMLDKLVSNLNFATGDSVNFCEKKGEDFDSLDDSNFHRSKIIKFENEICINNLKYKYPNTEKYIFENACLKIESGECIGIVGESGSGKTTLVDIILGLLHSESGCIKIDGVNINHDVKAWLSYVGYIPQMIFMLDDTIRENVTFGCKSNDEDAIWESLNEASLGDFVKTLPDGLETQIGERGVRLSGGQRQRIGIARALFRKPKVLFFDEATSALDNETETIIMDSVHKLQGKITMIIIAHRLSTLDNCDHIYKVENGKIIFER